MARFFSEDDFDLGVLKGEVLAVVGYGNQGHAHALNLRDSGFEVLVGARRGGGSWARAAADGFVVFEPGEAVERASTIMLTLPDEAMAEVWNSVKGGVREGDCVLFAHGFNVVYGLIDLVEGVDFGLIGPKGAGIKLRGEYLAGRGLAAIVAVEQDATGRAWDRVLGYTWGLGAFRALVMETSFREETHTDLFGEQAVLCGGIPELLKAGFDTLVEAGYSPEAAYFECIHEAKLITDLIYDRGIAEMRRAISNTAEWGGFLTGQSVIGATSRLAMREALENIQNGEFAEGWMEEARGGLKRMRAMEESEARHGSERPGAELRKRMGLQKE